MSDYTPKSKRKPGARGGHRTRRGTEMAASIAEAPLVSKPREAPASARNPRPIKPRECPVCAAPYMALFDVLNATPERSVDLYVCLACQSFSSPLTAENSSASQVEWHKRIFDRNLGFADALFDCVEHQFGKPHGVLDIGCGAGALIKAAENRSIRGVGYDLDEESCAFGRETHGLDLRGETWSPSMDVGEIDLITCIMVLEHIHFPRPLMNALLTEAEARSCPLFISVPFVEKVWWPHLLNDTTADGNPFQQPHVNVTHFSRSGMRTAFEQMGARHFIEPADRIPWPGLFILPT